MKNITLAIDDHLLEKGREFAANQGKSLNKLIREYLEQVTAKPKDVKGLSDLWEMLDKLGASTQGWNFNREELYDRKVLRR